MTGTGARLPAADGPHLCVTASPLGALAVVWRRRQDGVCICRIWLPREGRLPEQAFLWEAAPLRKASCAAVDAFAEQLLRVLQGEPVNLDRSLLALEGCSPFQRQVLIVESAIPRGSVSTYGAIATEIDRPGGARAVGRALATNPFPLAVPCHRAVRADGGLGGFQGGGPMKRALLELEGIRFTADGRVAADCFHRGKLAAKAWPL